MAEERQETMMQCPHCEAVVFAVSASDNGEPYFEPGWICPECGEFVSDEEDCEEEEATQ